MFQEMPDDLLLGRRAGAATLADVDDPAIGPALGQQALARQIIADNDFGSPKALDSAQGN
jgi:hypothetical protein